ncbi:UDP-N-acetylglucosamine 2-epimerase [Albibacterium sp.]|uniref:UDP-N-acetylglucosamine 2-epimerase n=1 Tax=Albibacterium sp. TaxID=2952885 RepID=UPI002B810A2B|nr:UDP-N-acetylglucosamine 2-epimerase [Albibacterium sp.]HUH18929.1 UDP-N-acetylglucosamine 2-epimerase [Albibacterium sp.]
MRVAVLTSSRADFGIYLPLLNRLKEDPFFELEIIAFGTHLSKFHGYTLDQIKDSGFNSIHKITSLLTNDDEVSIATSFGLTVLKFADFWDQHSYDWVLCLGDRFEMAAAVQAGIPFGVRFAHIHGGETTLGAIDNIYRHQISLASQLHFPATDDFAKRIESLTGNAANIVTAGSLSIDELESMEIPSETDFREKYQIHGDFALLTFHPETVSPESNYENAREMLNALLQVAEKIQLVITMPNADTFGSVFRKVLLELNEKRLQQVKLIENFGKLNYFAAMQYCKFLLGNTSSGIIEAASFGKYVINVGSRQKGRAQSQNIINCPFESLKIQEAVQTVINRPTYSGENIYKKVGTADIIIKTLKNFK